MDVAFLLSFKVTHPPEFSVVVLSWKMSVLGQVKLPKFQTGLIFCRVLERSHCLVAGIGEFN